MNVSFVASVLIWSILIGTVTSFSMKFTCSRQLMQFASHHLHKSFMLKRSYQSNLRAVSMVSVATDTIFALSSGPMVKSGVAVIRISGPSAEYCLKQLLTGPDVDKEELTILPKPRVAALRRLRSPSNRNDVLDQALVLRFPAPRSFTGEDVVELHIHGSRAVVTGIFNALEFLDCPEKGHAIRPAEAGEFTQRAFGNAKMDLTEVEGLSDLLDADTSEQRKQALKQMEGHMRVQYEKWREVLMGCLAHTEAVIDFGDDDREDDIDDDAMYALIPRVEQLRNELEIHLRDGRKGEIVRDGVKIALTGAPNAGKSSLMNTLARRPAAIVSPIAGTTRDIVEVRLDLAGVPCIVRDTAGLRTNSEDPVEIEGMRRAREAFDAADLKIFIADASAQDALQDSVRLWSSLMQSHDVNAIVEEQDEISSSDEDRVSKSLIVLNKVDLLADKSNCSAFQESFSTAIAEDTDKPPVMYSISCSTGEGIERLEKGIISAVMEMLSSTGSGGSDSSPLMNSGESIMITRERHRRHVKTCAGHLDRFLSGFLPMDAAAEELRLAMMELGKVTGRVDVEELLDIIFRDFCIGK